MKPKPKPKPKPTPFIERSRPVEFRAAAGYGEIPPGTRSGEFEDRGGRVHACKVLGPARGGLVPVEYLFGGRKTRGKILWSELRPD